MDSATANVLNALKNASDRQMAAITQIVYELARSGAFNDDAIGRITAVLQGGKPNHPDLP